MPYCPECEEEFRPEIKMCPECRVDLVDALKQAGDNLAVAFTVMYESKAHIIRGYLENEGIPCQLENATFNMEPVPVPALMKVMLWTRKEDVERARRLIREHEQFSVCSACGGVVLDEDRVCDFCGAGLEY
jgi:uncharacterized OB-fold protein